MFKVKAHTRVNTINAIRKKMQTNQEIKLQMSQRCPSNQH